VAIRLGVVAAASAVALSSASLATAAPQAILTPSSISTGHLAPRFDTESDLGDAEDRAERLRARLALLQARVEWTNERLAYVRGQLAEAATRSVTAEQRLAQLQGIDAAAAADLAHRVRAIEQSGGPVALYSQALSGASITDVASNLAALNAVLGADLAVASDAQGAAAQAATWQHQLSDVADQRAQLVGRARALAADAERLVVVQRHLLRNVDQSVRQLARTLASEREVAAAAAAEQFVPTGPYTESSNGYGSAAVAAALSKLGSTYVWGTEGPDTFDCSGLVQWAYGQAGLLLPRLASDQYFASAPVSVSSMEPGDVLVYAYDTHDANTIHHISMYIGNGLMVHAPRTGDVVRVVPVYYDGLYGVGRPGV
jgi:cell wall-associated NlpC family hydrolase